MERKNMDFSAITDKLRNLGYKVSEFETARDAAEYLGKEIKNKTVGFGGSITLEQMKLYLKAIRSIGIKEFPAAHPIRKSGSLQIQPIFIFLP